MLVDAAAKVGLGLRGCRARLEKLKELINDLVLFVVDGSKLLVMNVGTAYKYLDILRLNP